MTGVVLALAGLTCGDGGTPGDGKQLQGSWVLERAVPEGKVTEVLTFTRDRLLWTRVTNRAGRAIRERMEFTYTLDPSREPKRMKLRSEVPVAGPAAATFDAAYAVDGGTLRLAFIEPGKGPPKDFASKTDPDNGPFLFKRHKPSPPERSDDQ